MTTSERPWSAEPGGYGPRPMKRRDAEIEWILTGRVTGESRLEDGVPTGDVLVRDGEGRECWLTLSADGGGLLFDGRYVDVGDDFVSFIAVMDEIEESGSSEPHPDEGDWTCADLGPDHDCPLA
jgi:hypothetical protein